MIGLASANSGHHGNHIEPYLDYILLRYLTSSPKGNDRSPDSQHVIIETKFWHESRAVTCKNKKDSIKNEEARVFTTLYIDFSDAQGQITLESVVVSSRNWNSSKLSCMSSLPTRMKMIHTKMKEHECSQDFSHYKSMGIFSDAQGQLTPQSLVKFELVRDIMVVLVTCKYEEDPIKNEGASVFPIITLWELSVAMDTRVLIRSCPKHNAIFPPTQ